MEEEEKKVAEEKKAEVAEEKKTEEAAEEGKKEEAPAKAPPGEEKKTEEAAEEGKKEEAPAPEEKKPEDPKEEQPPAPVPQEIVLRVFMHCEGCARKVRRCLRDFEGVEDVIADCRTSEVVVKGEKADPIKVLERLQRKSRRKVELISPVPSEPEPQAKEEPKPDDNKPDQPPPVITVVLGVNMHCDACAQEIRRRIKRMKGVKSVEPDMNSSQVKVKGVFEAQKLVDYVYKRTGKHGVIIEIIEPEKKEEAKEIEEVKEEKKADEGETEAKKDEQAPKEGESDSAKAEPPTKTEAEVEAEVEDPNKMEVMKSEFYHYYYPENYEMYPPSYVEEMNAYPPQIFSDENPNACSVM